MSSSEDHPTEESPICYRLISIDEECEKWSQSSLPLDTDSVPCFTLLNQFYDELMIPTFPLDEERDDLDDWLECFRMQMKELRWKNQTRSDMRRQELSEEEQQLLQGNAMDVVIMILDKNITSEEDKNDTPTTKPLSARRHLSRLMSSFEGLYTPSSDETDMKYLNKPVIIGAAAVEYYKESRVGLLSYIVLHSEFRGQGLAAILHNKALSRLSRLATLYGKPKDVEDEDSTPLIQAVFAETNSAAAGDVTPEQSLLRHKALFKLGYRLVNFPYAQPPLCTRDVDGSFDDILLLVYFPFDERLSHDVGSAKESANDLYPWYQISSSTVPVQMDVNIPFSYVQDFYRSVFGYDSSEEHLASQDDVNGIPDYRTAKYFKLAHWFSRQRDNSRLVAVSVECPPWEDCKNALCLEFDEWQRRAV